MAATGYPVLCIAAAIPGMLSSIACCHAARVSPSKFS
jgi:hypothetical protein